MPSLGPRSPSTAVSTGSIFSQWASPTNVVSSNNAAASDSIGAGAFSETLIASGFDFAIPEGNYPVGIVVEIERAASGSGVRDSELYIYDLTTATNIGDNKAITGTGWPTTDAYATYGGATDMWGAELLTREFLNSDDFAVAFKVTNTSGSSRDVYVDHIRVTIYYEPSNDSLATFTDEFSDGSIDAQWTITAGSMSPVESGGVLTFTQSGTEFGAGTLSIATSDDPYDFAESHLTAKVIPSPTTLSANIVFTLEVYQDATHRYYIQGGSTGNVISAWMNNNSATPTQIGSNITYNPTTHAWWRIRHSGLTIYFDTSSDGETWTNRWTTAVGTSADGWNLRSVKPRLTAMRETNMTAWSVSFDNIGGIPPITLKSATDSDQIIGTDTVVSNAWVNTDRSLNVTDSDNVVGTDAVTTAIVSAYNATDSDQVIATEVADVEITVLAVFATDSDTVGSDEDANWSVYAHDTDTVIGIDLVSTAKPELSVPSLDEIITGQIGTLTYSFGVRYYDSNLVLLDDLSEYVMGLAVDWDETRSIKRTCRFEFIPHLYELEHASFVEPFVTLEIPAVELDEPVLQEISFGYFTDLQHTMTIRQSGHTISYVGNDLLTRLVGKTVNTIYTLPAGASYMTAIRTLCMAAGFTSTDIVMPYTLQTATTTLTWEAGTTYYAIVSQLADALNWNSPYVDIDNKLYFEEMEDYNLALPDVVYATDNNSIILPDISHVHENYAVVNHIVLTVDDPLRVPFTVTYTNNNVDNEYSYTNTGVMVSRLIDSLDHIADSTLATQRAKLIMQRETAPHTMNLTTWLDFRRRFYELYHVNISLPDIGHNHISSLWRCTAWSMTLDNGGSMTHTLKEVLEV